jgi:hypothetical protein
MSAYFKTLLQRQISRINFDGAVWAFPILVGASWVLWPAIDYEWKMSMGLAADPEASINYVQKLKDQRLVAHHLAAAASSGKTTIKKEVEEEEEEEEEEAAAEEEGGDEEGGEEEGGDEKGGDEKGGDEEGGGDDDEEEGGGDDEEDEEEEEDDGEPKKLDIPSLYDPVKGEKVAIADQWDNFTLKALNMSDDDDDEDEDEE